MADPKDPNPSTVDDMADLPELRELHGLIEKAKEHSSSSANPGTVDIDDESGSFRAGDGVFMSEHTSLSARILDAWKDMRASTRRMINEAPSEARLLFFVLVSDLIFFLSWSIKVVVSPTAVAESVMPEDSALLLVGALLVRTMSIYVFAMVVAAVLRILGGKGSWKDTRTGIFWGSFVAAPFGLLAAFLSVVFNYLENFIPIFGSDTVALIPLWLGLLPYIWFVSAGAAEAQAHKKVFPIFAVLSLLCVVGLFYAMYLRANGVI